MPFDFPSCVLAFLNSPSLVLIVSRATLKKRAQPQQYVPLPYTLPVREWDRATELVKMFAVTGFIKGDHPHSMLLISEPGSGKTELLERFAKNPWLEYASDLTTRGLYPLLKMARQGATTHVVATEFQKFFLRKSATAESTLGTLCQAMEEGVSNVLVGDKPINFDGATIGLIGAITHDTVAKWRAPLREYGFWSRCAAFNWDMPLTEMRAVMRSISIGDKSDLEPIALRVPDAPIEVEFPVLLSEQFEEFVFKKFKEYTVLRVFMRFRALAKACALLDGRDVVKACDVEKVVAFDPYWTRMER